MFKMAIKKSINFIKLFHFTEELTKHSLKGSISLSNKLHTIICFNLSYNIYQIRRCSVKIIIIDNGEVSTIYRYSNDRHTSLHYTWNIRSQ